MSSPATRSLGTRLTFAALLLVGFGVAALVVGFWVAGCNSDNVFGACVLARPTLGAAVGSLIGGAGLALSFRTMWPGTRRWFLWLPAAVIAIGFWVFIAFID